MKKTMTDEEICSQTLFEDQKEKFTFIKNKYVVIYY